jgi:hypothetical protein
MLYCTSIVEMYNKLTAVMITAHPRLHQLTSVAVATPSCTTTLTLTDTMPSRFVVPALIAGMILTVRITISFLN